MTLNSEIFSTGKFFLSASVYVKREASMWFTRNWWWIIAGPVALVMGSAWIPVLIFVALMLLCLLYPGVMMMVYFHYSLSPFARATLYSQCVILTDKALSRDFFPDDRFAQVPEPQSFLMTDIERVQIVGKYVFIKIYGGKDRLIAVPLSAIPDEQHIELDRWINGCGMDFAR